jgi:acyl-CoA synthetase (AMP-forming)/AMP-acid ligase II
MVREAIVVVDKQELVAVIVPSDAALSVLEVKRHCASRLPKYMVPFGVRLVSDLPRTSSGKTDRVRTAAAVNADDRSVLVPFLESGTP